MSHNELETKEKFNTIQSLLGGDHIFVHVDSRSENIVLPDDLAGKHNVTLKLSKLFRGKIEVTKDKIEAELLFPEGYHSCIVPLAAIWGITDEEGKNMIWPQSTPKEILEEMETSSVEPAAAGPEAMPNDEEATAKENKKETPISESKVAKKKIPHLKRVK